MNAAPTTPMRDQPSSAETFNGVSATVNQAQLEASLRDRERLDAVLQTGLLDTPAEETFDRLTRLAAKLVKVPATFISLVDEQRDFYKSCFGLSGPLSATRELEGRTFCHFALVSSSPLLIPDTMADPVFREVPTVQSLGVRAYAGIPLITDSGQAIGSFCAIDFVPRAWTPLEVEVLSELAGSALREIKLRTALSDAETQTRAAQEATRAREEVLAVVAHDLRTPLSFFKMGTQLVAEDPAGEESMELLVRMERSVDQMSRLIEDLLEVAKLKAGALALKLRPVSAEMLLDDAFSMLKPLAERHSIALVLKAERGLPLVLADYEPILRVFTNLVVNAVKFSSQNSDVQVTAARQGDSMVRFCVSDTGAGIAPEHLARLFDRFWQVDGADRRGAGLGLAIAKEIVTAHGGTIDATSALGTGSEFYFDLPVA